MGDAVRLLADGPPGTSSLQEAETAHARVWWQERPDVVYLDPMFPPRQKTALVKGEMQLMHRLLHPRKSAVKGLSIGTEADETTPGELTLDAVESEGMALLRCGLAWAQRRTVVKRPKNAPPLGGQKPSHSVIGSTSRFDVYVAPPGV